MYTITSIASLLLPLQSVLPFFSIARTWLSFDHSCPSSFTHCEDGVVLIVLALYQIFLVNDCNCYCCPQHEILCLIICLLQQPPIVPQNTDMYKLDK